MTFVNAKGEEVVRSVPTKGTAEYAAVSSNTVSSYYCQRLPPGKSSCSQLKPYVPNVNSTCECRFHWSISSILCIILCTFWFILIEREGGLKVSLDLWAHLTTACLCFLFYRPEDKHATPGHSKICHEGDLSSPMDPDLRSITAAEDCRIYLVHIIILLIHHACFLHDAEFVDHGTFLAAIMYIF
jgi:hypothetical protein